MSPVTDINGLCSSAQRVLKRWHRYEEWRMSHCTSLKVLWMSHVTHMNMGFRGMGKVGRGDGKDVNEARMSHGANMNALWISHWHVCEWGMNESCHRHEWVLWVWSRQEEAMAQIWMRNKMSHGKHLNEAWMSHVTDMNMGSFGTVKIGRGDGTDMNELRTSHGTHTDEAWMSHVTDMNNFYMYAGRGDGTSCHTYQGVMSQIRIFFFCVVKGVEVMAQIWISHVKHMMESCHKIPMCSFGVATKGNMRMYDCVMPHIEISCVTGEKGLQYTYGWVTSHIRMSHVLHMNESCRTH